MTQAQEFQPFPLIARHSRPVRREITHRRHLDELPAGPAAKGMAADRLRRSNNSQNDRLWNAEWRCMASSSRLMDCTLVSFYAADRKLTVYVAMTHCRSCVDGRDGIDMDRAAFAKYGAAHAGDKCRRRLAWKSLVPDLHRGIQVLGP